MARASSWGQGRILFCSNIAQFHAILRIPHRADEEWGHDYTIGTLDMLQACDACSDLGMTYSVIVQCADCVVFSEWVWR